MVRGLKLFSDWFEPYGDQYLLIGGTAATLAMEAAGLPFRATKDLDVVLHVEALTPRFGETFWRFIETGGYAIRQSLETGRPCFYRFQKPADPSFPVMIELFSRALDDLPLSVGSRCTPIPLGEEISSLSAILLDDVYYDFILAGRRESDGLSWIGPDRLIPLKAVAWLDLSRRKAQGEAVDSANVRKHLRDIEVLSGLLSARTVHVVHERIRADLTRFLHEVAHERQADGRALAGPGSGEELRRRLAAAYELGTAARGGETSGDQGLASATSVE